MKAENIILDKSFAFALRILKLYLFLRKKKVDTGLCSQILDSGTAIGANVEEAIGGSSRKDFINKMQIAYKEARETKYWLRLLKEGELIDKKLADSFFKRLRRNPQNTYCNIKFFKRLQVILNF